MRNLFLFVPVFLFITCSQPDTEVSLVNTEIDLIHKFKYANIKSSSPELFVRQDFKSITLDQNRRWSLFSHPNSEINYSNLNITNPLAFNFFIGLDEQAWNDSATTKTDGVEFSIFNSKDEEIYSRFLNPAKNPMDKGWIKESVDISNYSAESLRELTLKTKSGNSTTSDWAYWAEPKIIMNGTKETHYDSQKPNVILITIDTLRKDFLNCYGQEWIDTPNIDFLAANGILFENAYATSSTTSPSHVSIFTSLYPYNHGVIGNIYYKADKIPTFTQIMSEMNYKTGAAVSIVHLKKNICGLGNYFDTYHEPIDTTDTDKWKLTNSGYSTVSAGIEFMDENHNNPFFLWLHVYDPHMPYIPTADYDYMYYSGNPKSPEFNSMNDAFFDRLFNINNEQWMIGIRDINFFKRQYGAEITYIDDQIGRVLEALNRLNIDDNTIIAFTADHGESLGEHDIYFNHWSLHDVEIAVPLILYYPKQLPKGKRIDDRVSIIDIAPTLLDVLGEEDNFFNQNIFDGISLTPYWKQNKTIESRDHIFANSLNYIQTASIGERYKVNWYIRGAIYNEEHLVLTKDKVRVFDLINDPEENSPVASFIWDAEPQPRPDGFKDMELDDKLMIIRDESCQRKAPTIAELKQRLASGKTDHHIDPALKNDEEFYQEVHFALERILAQMCADIKDKLVKIPGITSFENELEWRSGNITDPTVQDQLNSLGYGAD